jgi:hypothetical protein
MQLLGQPVKHITFGDGTVTGISDRDITITFGQDKKRFLYPDAFATYLTVKDAQLQNELHEKCTRKAQNKAAELKKACERRARNKKIRAMKISPNAQAVFNLEYDQAQNAIRSGWVDAGCYLSGKSKGEPRIPSRLKPNSSCLLTGLPADNSTEENRHIWGAFMVKEDFWGERCKDGHILRHDRYQICLPKDAALPYWRYFDHGDCCPRWGQVAFKYFPNDIMQRILLDMTKAAAGTQQEWTVNEFYEYFCEINRLSDIGAASGVQ